ncbi:hypothetical protein HGG76_08645 [Ochrobactrum tritici]|uniref:Uncharacterized protein n=1 Tax=Brucella tritici TaxID=94626 RepID=A0A7X6JA95_9HYPH|nr:hypothetical protein [Brucella tritici]
MRLTADVTTGSGVAGRGFGVTRFIGDWCVVVGAKGRASGLAHQSAAKIARAKSSAAGQPQQSSSRGVLFFSRISLRLVLTLAN